MNCFKTCKTPSSAPASAATTPTRRNSVDVVEENIVRMRMLEQGLRDAGFIGEATSDYKINPKS